MYIYSDIGEIQFIQIYKAGNPPPSIAYIQKKIGLVQVPLLYPMQQSCEGYKVFDQSVCLSVLLFCKATPLK